MKTFHVFYVKYLGPTNSRGSRVKIETKRFEQSVTIPFNYTHNNTEDMAAEYLTSKGFKVVGCAEDLIMTETFEPLDNTKWQKALDARYPGIKVNPPAR